MTRCEDGAGPRASMVVVGVGMCEWGGVVGVGVCCQNVLHPTRVHRQIASNRVIGFAGQGSKEASEMRSRLEISEQ